MTVINHSVASPHFRPASPVDVGEVLTWVESRDQMRMWAGPDVSYPIVLNDFLQRICFSPDNAFICEDDGGLAAFAQLLEVEPGTHHVARLLVHPRVRGQGMGRFLSRCMIGEAKRRNATCVTLKVYTQNRRAVSLYRSLGFEEQPGKSSSEVLDMRLRLDQSSTNQELGMESPTEN